MTGPEPELAVLQPVRHAMDDGEQGPVGMAAQGEQLLRIGCAEGRCVLFGGEPGVVLLEEVACQRRILVEGEHHRTPVRGGRAIGVAADEDRVPESRLNTLQGSAQLPGSAPGAASRNMGPHFSCHDRTASA